VFRYSNAGFPEMPSLLQRIPPRGERLQQFGKNARRPAVAAELHFSRAISRVLFESDACSAPGHIPKSAPSAAETAQVKYELAPSQS